MAPVTGLLCGIYETYTNIPCREEEEEEEEFGIKRERRFLGGAHEEHVIVREGRGQRNLGRTHMDVQILGSLRLFCQVLVRGFTSRAPTTASLGRPLRSSCQTHGSIAYRLGYKDMTDTGANHSWFDTSFIRSFMVELIRSFYANPLTSVLEPWNALDALVFQSLKEEEEETSLINRKIQVQLAVAWRQT